MTDLNACFDIFDNFQFELQLGTSIYISACFPDEFRAQQFTFEHEHALRSWYKKTLKNVSYWLCAWLFTPKNRCNSAKNLLFSNTIPLELKLLLRRMNWTRLPINIICSNKYMIFLSGYLQQTVRISSSIRLLILCQDAERFHPTHWPFGDWYRELFSFVSGDHHRESQRGFLCELTAPLQFSWFIDQNCWRPRLQSFLIDAML